MSTVASEAAGGLPAQRAGRRRGRDGADRRGSRSGRAVPLALRLRAPDGAPGGGDDEPDPDGGVRCAGAELARVDLAGGAVPGRSCAAIAAASCGCRCRRRRTRWRSPTSPPGSGWGRITRCCDWCGACLTWAKGSRGRWWLSRWRCVDLECYWRAGGEEPVVSTPRTSARPHDSRVEENCLPVHVGEVVEVVAECLKIAIGIACHHRPSFHNALFVERDIKSGLNELHPQRGRTGP